jgi:hypothetical protein
MRNPVEISLRGIPHSAELEQYVGEQARKLERICDRGLVCRVVAQALHLPKRQGVQLAVGLAITLPGTEIVINREHGDDIFVALRDAFEAAGLQLNDHMLRSGAARRSRSGTPDRGG